MKNIQAIMAPKSIAVVGATNRPGSVGHAVFANILNGGYQGVLYPVNPKARAVQSVRAYPSLGQVPDEVDMAVLIVPAEQVPEVMEQAAAVKVLVPEDRVVDAEEVVSEFVEETKSQAAAAPSFTPWTCPCCHEHNDGTFDICWNCQSEKG